MKITNLNSKITVGKFNGVTINSAIASDPISVKKLVEEKKLIVSDQIMYLIDAQCEIENGLNDSEIFYDIF